MVRTPDPDEAAPGRVSRRQFASLIGASAGFLLGCGRGIAEALAGSARLSARPGSPAEKGSSGTHPLGTGEEPSGFLQVPATYRPDTPIPLVIALHGAGGRARDPLERLAPLAEARGFGVVAMNSVSSTWDAIRGNYGPDVRRIDAALHQVFQRVRIDPARLVIQGFSDGASYALGVGLVNGDLFPRIVAFSPGFIPPSSSRRQGRPELFISHGRDDRILDIDRTSRMIVQQLRGERYPVEYREFEGGHGVPGEVAQSAIDWLLR